MDICFVDFTSTALNENSAFFWDLKSKKLLMNFSVLKSVIPALNIFAEEMLLNTQELHIAAIIFLLFHEANHILQGLSEYESVKVIKDSGRERLICEFDIISDTVAARIYAGITLQGTNPNRKRYFQQVYGALSLSFGVLTHAFPFDVYKRFKVSRGLSLLVIRDRLKDAIEGEKFEPAYFKAVEASVSNSTGFLVASTIECNDKQIATLADLGRGQTFALKKSISIGDLQQAETILRAVPKREVHKNSILFLDK